VKRNTVKPRSAATECHDGEHIVISASRLMCLRHFWWRRCMWWCISLWQMNMK